MQQITIIYLNMKFANGFKHFDRCSYYWSPVVVQHLAWGHSVVYYKFYSMNWYEWFFRTFNIIILSLHVSFDTKYYGIWQKIMVW